MSIDPIAELQLPDFASYVGETLDVDFGAGPVAARILEANPVGGYTPRASGGFMVTLKAPVNSIQQGVFRIHHPKLGSLDLMMTPRRADASGVIFDFVIN